MTRGIPPRAVGYLLALSAAALWGSSGPLSTLLFQWGVPPSSVALLRPLVGLVFLFLLIPFRGAAAVRIPANAIPGVVILGGFVVAVFQMAYQRSTDAVGVPSTVALLYLAPGLVVLASPWLLREPFTLARGSLAALSGMGVWLAVSGARGEVIGLEGTGVGWGLLAAVGFASYTVFARHFAPRVGAFQALFFSTAGACGFLSLWLLFTHGELGLPRDAEGWAVLGALGVLTLALAPLLYFHALRKIEAGRVAIAASVEPLVATLLALTFLGQGLDPLGWVGLALLTCGVIGAYRVR